LNFICLVFVNIIYNVNEIYFSYQYLICYFQLKHMVLATDVLDMKRAQFWSRVATWILILLGSACVVMNEWYAYLIEYKFYKGDPRGYDDHNELTGFFAYVEVLFELVVVTSLAVTVCKIWSLLRKNENLEANEKSMIPKIIFSSLSWLAGLALLVSETISVLQRTEKKLQPWIDNIILYEEMYLLYQVLR